MSSSSPIRLPKSYSSLATTQIKLSHIPETNTTPTPIILLTLYRPSKYNAFTDTMMEEMEHAFRLFDADDRVKCIVVTGHGRMFCAGADLDEGFKKEGDARDARDGGGRVTLAIHQCRKPVIAAINGSAVGVGITMTLPMSIRIASSSAKIGFVFARRGLVMEAASSFFLPRLVGHSRAMHLITTGSTHPATSPLLSPLFSEILSSPEQVLPRALQIATEVVENTSTVSFALMRDMMFRGPSSAEATHLLDSKVIHELFGTKDNTEGIQSFLEKRKVRFEGTVGEGPAVWPWWNEVETRRRIGVLDEKKGSKL